MNKKEKIVVLTGAGISAPSGINTFRGKNGIWNNSDLARLSSIESWQNTPCEVLDFFNERVSQFKKATPNKAHIAIAELEQKYDVVVITQNIDDLHEKAGSTNIIHVHGEYRKARSSENSSLIYDIKENGIKIGDLCKLGSQLRPHIVFFGEDVLMYDEAVQEIKSASKIIVIGTSLLVYPFANLLKKAKYSAEKIIINNEVIEKVPYSYKFLKGDCETLVPLIFMKWNF